MRWEGLRQVIAARRSAVLRLQAVVGVCLFVLVAALTSLTVLSAAQQLERSPNRIDPLLRIVPLEKERVRPNSAPGLSLAPVPGKQTVVLHPHPGESNSPQTPPIVLRIPQSFFSKTSTTPVQVFGINLLLKYPSMTPFVESINSCRGWCEGIMHVGLENRHVGRRSAASQGMKAVREDIARQAAMSDPLISYTPIKPPPDYDEAFDVVYLKWKDGDRQKQYFFRDQRIDSDSEFVVCNPLVPSPWCNFLTSTQRRLELNFSYGMDLWGERRAIQAALIGLVNSFHDGEVFR